MLKTIEHKDCVIFSQAAATRRVLEIKSEYPQCGFEILEDEDGNEVGCILELYPGQYLRKDGSIR